MCRAWLYAALLTLGTLAVYAQTLDFGYVSFDDAAYVTEVPMVARGLTREGVVWAFSETHGVVWQPVTWLSHMLDFELFGGDPGGPHAVNALLHLLNVLLFFRLLQRATGEAGPSAFAAALLALHPLHVESVAWVVERKDLLAAGGALGCMLAYLEWTRRGGAAFYAAALLAACVGLMAKPSIVTLPALLLLLDHWPLNRCNGREELGRRVLEKLPFAAVAGATALITLSVQRGAMSAGGGLGLAERVANALLSSAIYLRNTAWPAELAIQLPHPYIPGTGGEPPALWWLACCALGLLMLTAFALRPATPAPVRVGWLWYCIALLPMSGLVQVGSQGLADRYTYLPHMGLGIALAWGGRALLRRVPAPAELLPRLELTVGFALAAAWGITAHAQAATWRSSLTLFEQAVAVHPQNPASQLDLGRAYEVDLRPGDAERAYRAALAASPRYPAAHFNLANLLRARGDLAGAEQHTRAAMALAPGDPRALGNLAGLLLLQGRPGEAIEIYERLLETQPDDVVGLLGLSSARAGTGDLTTALALTERAHALAPADARVSAQLRRVRVAAGRQGSAPTAPPPAQ
jgi:Flp pilus assembly protein TadD